MRKYGPRVLKFVKTFLLFAIFKLAFDWWRSSFGNFAGVFHNYSGILVEAFCFALVWMLVTKFRKRKAMPERE